jgi:PGAP1-like protein
MSNANEFKGCRVTETLYNNEGAPYCNASFTPTNDEQRLAMFVHPKKVIPVVFLPGIMGSNLKFKTQPELNSIQDSELRLWRPDHTKFTLGISTLNASERRRLFDPDNSEVDVRGDIDMDLLEDLTDAKQETLDNWKNEYIRRGWGTVMFSSYGPLLSNLEYQLNHIFYRGSVSDHWQDTIFKRNNLKNWGELKGDKPLTVAELKKAARYWYPVWAVGYNWIRSNGEAGKYVSIWIDNIIDRYKKLGYDCEKVILVTHSMGGLAARAACSSSFGNAENKVLGIVHGELPATGAGAAYKRCHAGFEGGWNPATKVSQKVLGTDGPEVTAVFSNSPGALQLLPSKLYGSGWLQVHKPNGQSILSLPQSDPYSEIYNKRNPWWRLMDSNWLDPQPSEPVERRPSINVLWTNYLDKLDIAGLFHEKLGAYYHTNTHVHHGVDSNQKAWGDVIWKLKDTDNSGDNESYVRSSQYASEGNGKINITANRPNAMKDFKTSVRLQDPAEVGDGTVPKRSADAAAAASKFSAAMTGYDHQGSYQNQHVQEVTLYSIARLAQHSAL